MTLKLKNKKIQKWKRQKEGTSQFQETDDQIKELQIKT